MKKNSIIENVEITDIGAEGKVIARIDKMVIIVNGALPGDVVDLQVTRKKNNYLEAYPVKFHKLSEKRIDAFCEHFGVCGGCKWQNLPYNEQLNYKQNQVKDALQRIGKIPLPEMTPIHPSEKTTHYRNKLEFTFSNSRWFTKDEMINNQTEQKNALGFHLPQRFDKILDIHNCFLQPSPSNEIRNAVKNFALENNYPFYNLKTHEGFLRNMIIRTSSTGEVMVIVVFKYIDNQLQDRLLDFISDMFPEITSLLYVINDKFNDTITDQSVIKYKGNNYIIEEMEVLKFKVGPKSFFQPNTNQAYYLYKLAREYANLQGDEIVYDLYTGTGTIANFISRNASKVIGIEYVPEAIEDAKVNSELNNIKNTYFYSGDIKDIFNNQLFDIQGKPDALIIDPPRAGMHENVINTILNASPEKIVYISCNPATQARDINLLSVNYDLVRYQPVDMFPHTYHIENVALLVKK